MRYLVIAVLALVLGGLLGRQIWGKKEEAVDPIQVITTQLKTHAVVEHERQVAIWYRACPSVWGKTPQIFVAWPAKLSYELELKDVEVTKVGTVIKVKTADIHANEPAVPTDFMDYLSTTSIFTFANEQELVNHEITKASPIARYLTTYFLIRDPSLRGDFAEELQKLVEHLASALGVPVTQIDVEVPKPQLEVANWPKLPKVEICEGTLASVNGLPFAKYDYGSTVPIGFRPPQKQAGNGNLLNGTGDVPRGIASVYGAPPPNPKQR
jgi:hypothetical protein